ncbi:MULTISPECIES: hypothetical protein [unclassified Saccharopolyspora]|uniref:hypothetical protein n=1 Tax=unclassified Saccharopolyspora TaxID=2646250 RepID=UPI001CD2318D|nr:MULTISPECIES: hypothetical protein [unclassified Saccharopolyspora]MCA1185778.1 hypothetical protein [Saccharopolyspora sp. 6T]MCA1191690.1 hypothetical protein [Saccharopolyspora sp. 6V]
MTEQWICANRESRDVVSVAVGTYGDRDSAVRVWTGHPDVAMRAAWSLAEQATDSAAYCGSQVSLEQPLGQFRRDPRSGVVVVNVGTDSWKVVGREPSPLHYGWRQWRDIREWEVIAQGEAAKTPRGPRRFAVGGEGAL